MNMLVYIRSSQRVVLMTHRLATCALRLQS